MGILAIQKTKRIPGTLPSNPFFLLSLNYLLLLGSFLSGNDSEISTCTEMAIGARAASSARQMSAVSPPPPSPHLSVENLTSHPYSRRSLCHPFLSTFHSSSHLPLQQTSPLQLRVRNQPPKVVSIFSAFKCQLLDMTMYEPKMNVTFEGKIGILN